MWQKLTADVNSDGIIDESDHVDWEGANSFAEGLELAGASDWRLPTVEELFTLSDLARFQPSIDSSVFSSESGFYWSATPHAEFADLKWGVVFFDGGICNDNIREKFPVRAVRKL